MKVPWKYRKVTANEWDNIYNRYRDLSKGYHNSESHFDCSLGGKWYRSGMRLATDMFITSRSKYGAPFHWTRHKFCFCLEAGKDIVDCLAGVHNGRGNISWLVGQHYVGMCPFKDKWFLGLKMRKLTLRLGRK